MHSYRGRAEIARRLEALETKHESLARFTTAAVRVQNLTSATYFTITTGDRSTIPQVKDRIRQNLTLASGIASDTASYSNRDSFDSILNSAIGLLIVLAKHKDVPFDDLASLLLQMSTPIARRLVDISAIVESYGSDYASKWRSLVSG
jgi:hypothetical protein